MSIILTLLVVGTLLMLAEIFLPGLIAGILGFCCYLAAIGVAYQKYESPTTHYLAVGIIALGAVEFIVWLIWFPKSSMAGRFVSKGAIGDLGNDRPDLIGQKGVALTELRPSGAVRLESGAKVDVVTEGSMVERDTPVKVIDVEGLRVVVRVDQGE